MGPLISDCKPGLPLLEEIKGRCEFLITVAMYNEGAEEMKNTLSGVVKNLEAF